jgi:hypothetical protein
VLEADGHVTIRYSVAHHVGAFPSALNHRTSTYGLAQMDEPIALVENVSGCIARSRIGNTVMISGKSGHLLRDPDGANVR